MRVKVQLYRGALVLVMAACLYILSATITYAFRHPELTDTQRLLRIGDALLWR